MHLLHCFLYLAATGIFGFLLGRLLPKRWFSAERFPFRSQPWEEKLYRLLRVKQWQNKLPDMSRIFPKLMPAKRLTPQTCVAELIHALLSVSGLGFLWLWPGGWGIALTVVYILLGNVSFIIIQRYNRPRLVKLLEMQQKKAARTKKEDAECGR